VRRVKTAKDLFYTDPIGNKDPNLRAYSYESWAPCGNTNIGGGILAANDALTNPLDIRREAVWVMIVLSDGAANVTDPVGETVARSMARMATARGGHSAAYRAGAHMRSGSTLNVQP